MRYKILPFFCIVIGACGGRITPQNVSNQKLQMIPGRIQCELYNTGGEGVAYHDADSINNGSGKLNPVNGNPLHEFRLSEGVDISYTKKGGIDDNPYNKVNPDPDQLYVGWTVPGEWIRYSIEISQTGEYKLGVMYTSNGNGIIAFDLENKHLTGGLSLPSTHNDSDTIAWRQWHHWNRVDSLTNVKLKKGTHQLTLHIVGNGQMNFDYLEFTRINAMKGTGE